MAIAAPEDPPSLFITSCWKLEVVKGGLGWRRWGDVSIDVIVKVSLVNCSCSFFALPSDRTTTSSGFLS